MKHPRQNLLNSPKFIYADASPIANFTRLGRILMNSKKIISQLSAVFLLTLGSLILSPTIANSQQLTQETIDRWADDFFYSVNPQLSRRKLRANETLYIREWNAIQRVVPTILVYRNNECSRSQQYSWLLVNYDDENRPEGRLLVSEALDKVADAIFYSRNPELGGRKIRPGETALANEWMRIRRSVSLLPPCFY
jgi:hypothetical protein